MREEGKSMDYAGFIPSGFVDGSVLGAPNRYAVPRASSEASTKASPVVAVSIEEKVADLIQAYPHLGGFLKSHSHDPNARIRDLAISSGERDQLLYQIMAARRQQVPTPGNTRRTSPLANGSQARPRSYQARRKKPAQGWPKTGVRLSQAGLVTGKWHKRLWG